MAVLITPTTELEAVNACLTNIGESPVSSLTGTLSVDAATAQQLVRQITREVQTRGYYWNTEVEYTLLPNSEGKLQLPANTLSVDTTGDDYGSDIVARGKYLYDRREHTYSFTESKEVTLILALDFEEMPEAARRYVSAKALRIFQERIIGSSTQAQFNLRDEQEAMAELIADDIMVNDINLLDTMSGILGRNHY